MEANLTVVKGEVGGLEDLVVMSNSSWPTLLLSMLSHLSCRSAKHSRGRFESCEDRNAAGCSVGPRGEWGLEAGNVSNHASGSVEVALNKYQAEMQWYVESGSGTSGVEIEQTSGALGCVLTGVKMQTCAWSLTRQPNPNLFVTKKTALKVYC